jgi:hypothetical protein
VRTSVASARSYGVDRAAGTAGIGCRGGCDQIGERRLVADFACKTDRQLYDEVPSANPLAGHPNPIAGSLAETLVERIAYSFPVISPPTLEANKPWAFDALSWSTSAIALEK